MKERFPELILPIEPYPGEKGPFADDIVYKQDLRTVLRFYLFKTISIKGNDVHYKIRAERHAFDDTWTMRMGTAEYGEALTNPGTAGLFTIFRARKALVDSVNHQEYIIRRLQSEIGRTFYTAEEADRCKELLLNFMRDGTVPEDLSFLQRRALSARQEKKETPVLSPELILNSQNPLELYSAVFRKPFPASKTPEEAREMRFDLYIKMAEKIGWTVESVKEDKSKIIYSIPQP